MTKEQLEQGQALRTTIAGLEENLRSAEALQRNFTQENFGVRLKLLDYDHPNSRPSVEVSSTLDGPWSVVISATLQAIIRQLKDEIATAERQFAAL